MGLEKHRGRGGSLTFFSHRSPSLQTELVYVFAADWPLIKDHTPSAGGSTGEKGGRDSFSFAITQTNLG